MGNNNKKKKSRTNKKKGKQRPKQPPQPGAATTTHAAMAATLANLASLGLKDIAEPETLAAAFPGPPNNATEAATVVAFSTIDAATESDAKGTPKITAPKPSACFHGSTHDQMDSPTSTFYPIILEYTQVSMVKLKYENFREGTLENVKEAKRRFHLRHCATLMDPEFVRYLFAMSTRHYLENGYQATDPKVLERTVANPIDRATVQRMERGIFCEMVRLGISLKYRMHPGMAGEDVSVGSAWDSKFHKYFRDTNHERGLVNILARETPCACMKAAKAKFAGESKAEVCYGCGKEFPKNRLSYCACRVVVYCSRDCQVASWPHHKDFCRSYRSGKINRLYQPGGVDGDDDSDGSQAA